MWITTVELGDSATLTVLRARSCLTLCNPMDCSLPGSSVHGILQARILKWIAMPSSRGSSWLRAWTQVFCIGRQNLCHWVTWEAYIYIDIYFIFFSIIAYSRFEKEMATHSSLLAWRIPWREEPRGPESMGSQRVRHDWVAHAYSKLLNRVLWALAYYLVDPFYM